MKIYLFTIRHKEGRHTINKDYQIYAKDYFNALDSLQLITGSNDNDCEFMGYVNTTHPLKYGQNESVT